MAATGLWTWSGAGFNKDNYVPRKESCEARICRRYTELWCCTAFQISGVHQRCGAGLQVDGSKYRKYGGDTKRIFVAGHSAGGHLAALLATNQKYLKALGSLQNSSRVLSPSAALLSLWKSGGEGEAAHRPKAFC